MDLDPDPDPAKCSGSGSGSETLPKSTVTNERDESFGGNVEIILSNFGTNRHKSEEQMVTNWHNSEEQINTLRHIGAQIFAHKSSQILIRNRLLFDSNRMLL